MSRSAPEELTTAQAAVNLADSVGEAARDAVLGRETGPAEVEMVDMTGRPVAEQATVRVAGQEEGLGIDIGTVADRRKAFEGTSTTPAAPTSPGISAGNLGDDLFADDPDNLFSPENIAARAAEDKARAERAGLGGGGLFGDGEGVEVEDDGAETVILEDALEEREDPEPDATTPKPQTATPPTPPAAREVPERPTPNRELRDSIAGIGGEDARHEEAAKQAGQARADEAAELGAAARVRREAEAVAREVEARAAEGVSREAPGRVKIPDLFLGATGDDAGHEEAAREAVQARVDEAAELGAAARVRREAEAAARESEVRAAEGVSREAPGRVKIPAAFLEGSRTQDSALDGRPIGGAVDGIVARTVAELERGTSRTRVGEAAADVVLQEASEMGAHAEGLSAAAAALTGGVLSSSAQTVSSPGVTTPETSSPTTSTPTPSVPALSSPAPSSPDHSGQAQSSSAISSPEHSTTAPSSSEPSSPAQSEPAVGGKDGIDGKDGKSKEEGFGWKKLAIQMTKIVVAAVIAVAAGPLGPVIAIAALWLTRNLGVDDANKAKESELKGREEELKRMEGQLGAGREYVSDGPSPTRREPSPSSLAQSSTAQSASSPSSPAVSSPSQSSPARSTGPTRRPRQETREGMLSAAGISMEESSAAVEVSGAEASTPSSSGPELSATAVSSPSPLAAEAAADEPLSTAPARDEGLDEDAKDLAQRPDRVEARAALGLPDDTSADEIDAAITAAASAVRDSGGKGADAGRGSVSAGVTAAVDTPDLGKGGGR